MPKEKLYIRIIPQKDVNFHCPLSPIKVSMDINNRERNIYSMLKLEPHMDWGSFEVEWGIISPAEIEIDSSDIEGSTTSQVITSHDVNESMGAEINCPNCTFLNPVTAEICSACMNPLK
jgi:hypothetical protein